MRRYALPPFAASSINRVAWIVLAVLFLAAATVRADSGQAPKYVFLFIGDGMALAQRSAAEYFLAAKEGKPGPGAVRLAMNRMPVQGLTATSSLNSIITDSGAAGTAIASGVKTYNGAIGVDGAKNPVPTLAEKARDKGMKVGIISSVSLDHATPACFYSHQASRNNYYEIALDAAKSGFDYFGGGGFKDPAGKKSKTDGEKPNALDAMRTAGYTVADTREAILAAKPGTKLVAVNPELDADKALPYALDADGGGDDKGLTLAQYTTKGIELLDNPKGFFLMVEGGKIDWACHANDAAASISDTLAFDAAVAEAVAFAKAHPDETLIVVTGDHECGGLTLGFAGTRYGNYYDYLKSQKDSFLRFAAALAEYKKTHDATTARFEDVAPLIKESFGLVVPTAADLEAMKAAPKPNEDNTSPADPHGLYFKEFELAAVKEAFGRSMQNEKEKPGNEMDYRAYGGYEPLAVTLTHILGNKAGIGWTSYSHTGVPVVTSAQGPGAQAFAGYYDNTDLSKKMAAALGETAVASN
ncbi:Alkaline phosphatase [Solidesulfovibrio carbinoliphilus subsp. oakridgensis]|uniref:Alkaline phosphatase n=1 Tax=Solidesulfovibrio carbinoliphilus subsp. oakridgensis TaxID=694327 RepID=G7Q754_9BACT|nr:alkaline phosphatase [Solidesulfovibrio carbinoliphilus]EHJ49011.1 Alkaline phosphatase [Solidesulfovibrio carbinoliphilus subsp. oakridgensis]